MILWSVSFTLHIFIAAIPKLSIFNTKSIPPYGSQDTTSPGLTNVDQLVPGTWLVTSIVLDYHFTAEMLEL